jgi:phosphoribosyl-AMP cyclohydrolase
MKHKIRDLDSFGKVMNLYYSDKETLLKSIRKNDVSFFKKEKDDK